MTSVQSLPLQQLSQCGLCPTPSSQTAMPMHHQVMATQQWGPSSCYPLLPPSISDRSAHLCSYNVVPAGRLFLHCLVTMPTTVKELHRHSGTITANFCLVDLVCWSSDQYGDVTFITDTINVPLLRAKPETTILKSPHRGQPPTSPVLGFVI